MCKCHAAPANKRQQVTELISLCNKPDHGQYIRMVKFSRCENPFHPAKWGVVGIQVTTHAICTFLTCYVHSNFSGTSDFLEGFSMLDSVSICNEGNGKLSH